MRFDSIKEFRIDDLFLDEGNYRFKKASDQKECIRKIFATNNSYFRNLMESIAEDDLGEPLLVYQDPDTKHNVVMDGNRRAAALKVIVDPDCAPSPAIAKHAKRLSAIMAPSVSKVQAQVSSSKDLIYKTVYERHASGKGRSRINWAALAAARFRFDQDMIDDPKDWHPVALVFEVEKYDEWAGDFIDSDSYSHEVFRRVVNAAIKKKIISEKIFSEKLNKIKKSEKNLLEDALEKCVRILRSMKVGDLSLSRGKYYADLSRINDYLSDFELAPDVKKEKGEQQDGAAQEGDVEEDDGPEGGREHGSHGEGEADGGGPEEKGEDCEEDEDSKEGGEDSSGGPRQKPTRNKIARSDKIIQKLTTYDNPKIEELYESLCIISTNAHPSLMMAGAWMFMECMTKAAGKNDKSSLESFINEKIGKTGPWEVKKEDISEIRESVSYISKIGNLVKHGKRYTLPSATHLVQSFRILEPIVVLCIEEAIRIENEDG